MKTILNITAKKIKSTWYLYIIFCLFFKPKRFYRFYFLNFINLFRFYIACLPFFKARKINIANTEKTNLFLLSGNYIEPIWLQIWIVIRLIFDKKINNVFTISSKKALIPNIYFFLFNIVYI